jgi:hypothetical protein
MELLSANLIFANESISHYVVYQPMLVPLFTTILKFKVFILPLRKQPWNRN